MCVGQGVTYAINSQLLFVFTTVLYPYQTQMKSYAWWTMVL